MGFGGQVVSWTTQDSKAPRISLQRRRFPPIRPKPGQKRHIGESARWKRPDLVGWHLARAVEAPGPVSWHLARALVFHRVVTVVDIIKLFCG